MRVLSKSGSIGIGDFVDAGANAKNITLSYGKNIKIAEHDLRRCVARIPRWRRQLRLYLQ